MSMKSLTLTALCAFAVAAVPASASDKRSFTDGPRVKNDGYRFVNKQFEMKQVTIELVTFQTKKEFLEAARARGITNDNIAAFSVLKSPYDKCTIYMMDPQKSFRPDMAGHEFLHCFYGQWHRNNDQPS